MTYPYALPRLPYAPAALEPNLNRATIMTHHDRIFAGHIDGLNRALQPYPALQRRPLSRLLLHPDCLPAPARPDILHHGSGVYIHALYFSSLAPARTGNPDAALAESLRCSFGSMEDFLRALRQASLQDTQEGCTWLQRPPRKAAAALYSRPANGSAPCAHPVPSPSPPRLPAHLRR